MTCLVTGDRGFVGGHLVRYLKTQGYTVVGFDMLNDYPTVDVLADFIKRNDVTNVYHLGARPFIPDCYGMEIGSVVNSNIVFTANLLMACRKTDIDKLLYLSTSEVYGNSSKSPMDEDTPTKPDSTYAATKLASENLVRTFRKETGMDMRILRHFNIYGPKDTHPRIIPKLMYAAKHKIPVIIGPDNTIRDYSYVTDVCKALLNIMELSFQADFVRGTGIPTDINELIKIIGELYTTDILVIRDSSKIRPGEIMSLYSYPMLYNATFPNHFPISLKYGLTLTKHWYDKNDWSWEKNE